MKYKESFYNVIIDTDADDRLLLFNTVSNALAWFSKEVYRTFAQKSNIVEENIDSAIIINGFVVPQDKDELEEIKLTSRTITYSNNPEFLHYVIAPTMRCNYCCVYCFEKEHTRQQIMSEETLDATYNFIINQINNFKPKIGIHIQWFGGEPLLALGQIQRLSKKLIEYTRNHTLEYHSMIITNAFYLSEDVAKELKQLGISSAQITLDGTAKEYSRLKGCSIESFERVVDNIDKARKYLSINLRINIGKENVENIKELMYYLFITRKINVKTYLADIRSYDGCTKCETLDSESYTKHRHEIIEYGRNICKANNLSTGLPKRRLIACEATALREFVIGPDGKTYRCAHLLDREGMNSGDVFIGYSYQKIDTTFFENILPEKCNVCKLMPICMGGCPCDRIYDGIEKNCDAVRADIIFEVKKAVSDIKSS